jgi:hypothetical protein
MRSNSSWILAAIVVAGCVAPEDGTDDVVTSSIPQELGSGCPMWGCGQNSPVINAFNFHELNTDGTPNDVQLVVKGFSLNDVMYQPIVSGARLYAYDPSTGALKYGADLTGGAFIIYYPVSGSLPDGYVKLRVTNVTLATATNAVKFWQGSADGIETYELDYADLETPFDFRPVCHHPPPGIEDPEGQVYAQTLEAILFTGDRYAADTKTVIASTYADAGKWFNIACAGSALAKLHLNRHTTAGSTRDFTTTAGQRQTMLKMYSGDFCGTGDAYTVAGTPIHWLTTTGLSSPSITVNSVESFWGAGGASCLTVHRLHSSYSIDFQTEIQGSPGFPPFIPPTLGNCPKPACSQRLLGPVTWPRSAYMLTESPAT